MANLGIFELYPPWQLLHKGNGSSEPGDPSQKELLLKGWTRKFTVEPYSSQGMLHLQRGLDSIYPQICVSTSAIATNPKSNPTEPLWPRNRKSKEKLRCLCPWLLLPKPRSFEWKPTRKPHMAKSASEGCWGVIFCFKGRLLHSINFFFHCCLLSLSFPSNPYW